MKVTASFRSGSRLTANVAEETHKKPRELTHERGQASHSRFVERRIKEFCIRPIEILPTLNRHKKNRTQDTNTHSHCTFPLGMLFPRKLLQHNRPRLPAYDRPGDSEPLQRLCQADLDCCAVTQSHTYLLTHLARCRRLGRWRSICRWRCIGPGMRASQCTHSGSGR